MSDRPVSDCPEDLAVQALSADDPATKCMAARALSISVHQWPSGQDWPKPVLPVPARPGRPAKPELLPPSKMPRRGAGSERTRIALLHSVAHIELNAIDLACDMVARFAQDPVFDALPDPNARGNFVRDWAIVADDEARHFGWLQKRLAELGATYGDLPAHDGLWQAATATAHDLAARLAIVPLVHEARGLDVTPGIVKKLEKHGDQTSADILTQIHKEEIAHVAAGWRWFTALAEAKGFDAETRFRKLVDQYMPGGLKPPFDVKSRLKAGLLPHLYGEDPL